VNPCFRREREEHEELLVVTTSSKFVSATVNFVGYHAMRGRDRNSFNVPVALCSSVECLDSSQLMI